MINTLITSWPAIVAGSLALWVAFGVAIGRFCTMSDPGQDDDTQPNHPRLPKTLLVVTDDDYDADLPAWLFDVPSRPLSQDEFDRFEAILRGVA